MPENSMSIKELFLHADPVVQTVMILLFLASLASWVIILEKSVLLRRFGRESRLFVKIAAQNSEDSLEPDSYPVSTRPIVDVGLTESQDGAGQESRADFRERVERTMHQMLAYRLGRLIRRTMFLATVGSTCPFVGLFGTVWGIMHSFIGIAASGETTLAVVAPGISEALFATAMGLVAAIPAVVAYNKITSTVKNMASEAADGISHLGNRLARRHFEGWEFGEENE
ncbi:MAG: MotA/TolQ/ExbB proton channel family protein [Deltaproteobacteria bacterium]|jgi:biopolymer transport protein ExbB/TolQ|nr:MotA/TolQ/ExbB proton channel family protein [Deltaproteobacteria bacterium]